MKDHDTDDVFTLRLNWELGNSIILGPNLSQELNEFAAERNLHMDDDWDLIVERYLEANL